MKRVLILFVAIAVVVFGFVVILAKIQDSSSVYAHLGAEFSIKVNEQAYVSQQGASVTGLRITLINVTDSRCPTRVVCVWQGEAKVALHAQTSKKNSDFVLTKGPNKDAAAREFEGYSIRLVKVEPYPNATQKIVQSDYIVTLVVSRV